MPLRGPTVVTPAVPVLASDKKVLTSGDISGLTSTVFAVLDSGLNITLTTGARRCLIAWTLMANNSVGSESQVDVDIDGARQGQTFGLTFSGAGANNENYNLSGSYTTDVLSAGSHTFRLLFRVDGGSGKVYASSSIAPVVFSVVELAT